jgi:integration host factor subunit alpha
VCSWNAKSITRFNLAEAVHQQAPVTKEYAIDLDSQVLEAVCATLEQGEGVKLFSFGVFTARTKGKRIRCNPNAGVEVPIGPRRAVTFSASPVLKEHVTRSSFLSSGATCGSNLFRDGGRCDTG